MSKQILILIISISVILLFGLVLFFILRNNSQTQPKNYTTKNGIEYSLVSSTSEIQGNWKVSKLENINETYSGGSLKFENNQAGWQFCNSAGGKVESITNGKISIPQATSTLMYCEKQILNDLDAIIVDTNSTYFISKDGKILLLENSKFNVIFEK